MKAEEIFNHLADINEAFTAADLSGRKPHVKLKHLDVLTDMVILLATDIRKKMEQGHVPTKENLKDIARAVMLISNVRRGYPGERGNTQAVQENIDGEDIQRREG